MRFDATTDLQTVWAAFKSEGDEEARESLIVRYAPLVKYVAGRLSSTLPRNVEAADLVSYGVFGLIDAIDKFDLGRGIKFETYAIARIKGAIIDELRALDWVPRSMRSRAREFEVAVVTLEHRLKRAPLDDEIATEMGVTTHQLQGILSQLSYASVISFEDLWANTGERDDHRDPLGAIADVQAPDPVAIFDNRELKRVLAEGIEALPDREKTVIALYYYEGLTLKEIGAVLGVSESRSSQLHTSAVLRLRAHVHAAQGSLAAL